MQKAVRKQTGFATFLFTLVNSVKGLTFLLRKFTGNHALNVGG